MTTSGTGHLYFHSPCFDGIASAVLAWDYLEARQGWGEVELHPVNYDLKEKWIALKLESPAAVVDFLYHPSARFWADHHATSFLTPALEADFRKPSEAVRFYDREAGSCALVLWRELHSRFGHRQARYQELVSWADRIDAARYDTPEEAVFSPSPALRISASLAVGEQERHPLDLVRALKRMSLAETAALPEVRRRAEQFDRLVRAGVERFETAAKLKDGIVTFDVDGADVMVSRYSPFLKPERRRARYSAGIVRFQGGAKITTMRNPWLEFESVPLGELCARFGGGGHRRVGSILLEGDRSQQAGAILRQLVEGIQEAERRAHPVSAR